MTRESRVALFVGLAFIILFGLVLGQRSLSLSAAHGPGAAAPGTYPPPEGPGAEMVAAEISEEDYRPAPAPASTRRQPPARPPAEPRSRGRSPAAVVRRRQVPIQADGPDREAPAGAARRSRLAGPRVRTYRVRRGDTLIRIARKVYGRGREEAYLRIYNANRDKMRNPSRVLVGVVLVIPPLGLTSPGPSGRQDVARARRRQPHYREMTLEALAGHFDRGRSYVVRAGDCLTVIARRQLGDGSAAGVRKLLTANRDRIADPDLLRVGLELRIPSGA